MHGTNTKKINSMSQLRSTYNLRWGKVSSDWEF